ncbi:MAG: hypothetical protein ABIH86_04695 [Planctomycetota bacterium]
MSDEIPPESDLADGNKLLELEQRIKDEIYKELSNLLCIWLCLINLSAIFLYTKIVSNIKDIFVSLGVDLPIATVFALSRFGIIPGGVILVLGIAKELYYKDHQLTLRLNLAYMVAIVITAYFYYIALILPLIKMQEALQS